MTALQQETQNETQNSQSTVKTSSQTQSSQLSAKEQQIQAHKDRTLFCINIDEKCTEDILYELFLQVGPIDNIIRKADRNGNIISLVTYKHIESCEYAIKLFNGINLFNQSLKVQFCQNSQLNTRSSTTTSSTTTSTSSRHTERSRHSIESSSQQPNPVNISMQPLMLTAQQNLLQLMSPLIQQFSPLFNQQTSLVSDYNRSKSGLNLCEQDVDYRPRRRNDRQENVSYNSRGSSQHQHHHGNYGSNSYRGRDNSHFDSRERKSNRSRSRSPLDKRRRF